MSIRFDPQAFSTPARAPRRHTEHNLDEEEDLYDDPSTILDVPLQHSMLADDSEFVPRPDSPASSVHLNDDSEEEPQPSKHILMHFALF